ncbi:MAG: 50S ribosomal protein L32 [Candidatus Wildermuthbacteria bacterium]|nr:50S ribosomal protein L32 [Candidatus Wildermuthbacteria bacterium]
MAVPKGRHTKRRRNNRRMHLFLKPLLFAKCPKCGKPVLPHTICQECGFYKGVEYINVLENLTKKEKKQKEKEMKAKEMESFSDKAALGRSPTGEAGNKKSLSWENLSKSR